MNRRHRAAQLAGRASVQLHTLIFFASDAAKLMVPRYGIEGRVKLPIESDDPKLVRVPNEHKVLYDKASVQVFDRIRVKIWVREVQDYQRELVVELVSPSFLLEKSKKRKSDSATNSDYRKKSRRKA
eukprot:CAMPEP_0178771268 /NCGR_PEP_ID=MMETSP0744-20121128/21847_1 /TAXON_ID=913974 /ORGANISM="Nitzschia punctata, Strain CCMP561" /LENGTH=126 /DNA_ID=CAMNT_0020427725 /DNA_START=422 /DNA_END=802 /DNA_ORIENTATION=-